jgi:proteasome lid subunit RPN8/RPN11
MTFFTAVTTPAPRLEAPAALWASLLQHLRMQGSGVRESGAFLLGRKDMGRRAVTAVVPYEQLQADALHDDYVSLSAESFAKLWAHCREQNLSVVADIHTHRFGAGQSRSDRANPMVAQPGHIAFIVPHFAQGSISLADLGMYIYLGNHRWISHAGAAVTRLVRLSGGAS